MDDLSNPAETPRADPHAGCCGGWGLNTPGYPIRPRLGQRGPASYGVMASSAPVVDNETVGTIVAGLVGPLHGHPF